MHKMVREAEVLYFEKAGPWGSRLKPRALALAQLRLQLRARGLQPRGCKRELIKQLEDTLAAEMQESWKERMENLTAVQRRLKDLIRRSQEEDATFNLGKVNEWIQEERSEGKWDWATHPKSLELQRKERRRKFEIAQRKKQRKQFMQHTLFTKVHTLPRRRVTSSRGPSSFIPPEPKREDLTNVSDAGRCSWKSTVDGVGYHCVNRRMGGAGPESNVCGFHAHLCTKDHAAIEATLHISPVIKRPNKDGLCLHCFREKYRYHPPSFGKHECPGVHTFSRARMQRLLAVQEAVEALVSGEKSGSRKQVRQERSERKGSLRGEMPKCRWKKRLNNENLICTNDVMTHLTTGAVTSRCAYHAKVCTLQHEAGLDDIGIPNDLGMCLVHYKQQRDCPPTSTEWISLPAQSQLFPPGVCTRKPRTETGRPHPLRPHANTRRDSVSTTSSRPVHQQRRVSLFFMNWQEEGANRRKGKWAKGKWHKLEWSRKGRAALVIQRVARGWSERRVCRAKHQLREMRKRTIASTQIQAQVRGCLTRGQTKSLRQRLLRSVLLVQNKYRRYAAGKVLRRLKAIVLLQRCFRGMLDRLNVAAIRVLQRVGDVQGDVLWANNVITVYLAMFIHRWKKRKQAKKLRAHLPQIVRIQALIRRFLVRFHRKTDSAAPRRNAAAIRIQAFMRRYLVKEPEEVKNENEYAAIILQAAWRGFRCRILLLLKREATKGFRSWLNIANASDGYALLLRKEFYDCPDKRDKVQRNRNPRREIGKLYGERPEWTLALFKGVDPDGVGLIRRYEFQEVLRGMPYPISELQVKQLTLHWSLPNGLVCYPPFVRFARQQLKPCNKHRVWTCCVCVSYGKCEKCLCKRFVSSESRSERQPSARSVCTCGHYYMVHELSPYEAHAKEQTDDRRITKAELTTMLTREVEPEFTPRAQGVCITPLSDTEARATTPITLETIAKTQPESSSTMVSLPAKPSSRGKQSLSRCFFEGAARPYTAAGFKRRGRRQRDGLPVIVADELVSEVNCNAFYVDVLLALADPAVALVEDSQTFVGFVFKALTFLQKYWKQLIYDIRTGSLSKQIALNASARQMVEQRLEANPRRAKQIENALRGLGFDTTTKSKDNFLDEIERVQPVAELLGKAVSLRRKRRETLPAIPTCPKPTVHSTIDAATTPESDERNEHELMIKLLTAPRFKRDPVEVAGGRKARPFICTFPGCSRSFTHPQSAEEHFVQAHQSCARLAVRRVEVDEELHRFWPKRCPWTSRKAKPGAREIELYREVDAISLPYKCDRQNCGRRFEKRKELKAHIQFVHSRPEKLAALIGPVQPTQSTMRGSICHVPPASLPEPLSLPLCKKHWLMYRPNCDVCERYIAKGLPLAPLECFEMVRVYIQGAGDIIRSNQAMEACNPQMQTLVKSLLSDEERTETLRIRGVSAVLLLRNQGSVSDMCFGRIVGLMRDKTGRSFIAYHELLSTQSLANMMQSTGSTAYGSVGGDLDDDNELIEHTHVQYVQLHSLVGSFYVLQCDRAEYTQRAKDKDLPLNPYGRPSPFFSSRYFDGRNVT